MAKAPVPTSIPGEFFVLTYTRLTGRYVIYFDDVDQTSYDLGSDIEKVWRQFEFWGMEGLGRNACDRARNFKMVQVIPEQGRIINIFKRANESKRDVFAEDKKRRQNAGLRSLH